VRRCGKNWCLPEFLSETNKEHALPHLRNTVVNGVKQRVGGNKVELIQLDRDFLGNVAFACREGIRHVFNDHGYGLEFAHPRDPTFVQARARIL
jgi:hypothetical protein